MISYPKTVIDLGRIITAVSFQADMNQEQKSTSEEYAETNEENSTTDSDSETEGVLDSGDPYRFIFDDVARARSLNAIAYARDEKGLYYVIDEDESQHTGLLVDALIRCNIKDGILSPIEPIPKPKKTDNFDGSSILQQGEK